MGIMMIAGTERRHQGYSLQDGKQWGFSITLPFESQLYYQPYPISFTVGPFTNILTTVSDEVNGVAYTPTTVNWYKDKFGIVCDYYSNGAYVNPKSVTFISLGI